MQEYEIRPGKVWDEQGDGLFTSHTVTIWTSTGTQLVQATIPTGTGGTLTDGFRYVCYRAVHAGCRDLYNRWLLFRWVG